MESPGAQVLPLAGLSSSLKELGPRRPFAGTGGRLVKRDYIMGVRPYPPSSPLTPHQDFAERNGFCTRSFFIIKLTVSTPSSWPRLLPGEATPPFLPGSARIVRTSWAVRQRSRSPSPLVSLPRLAPPPGPRACAVGPGSGAGAGGNRSATVRRGELAGTLTRGGGARSAAGGSGSGSP